jgi:hypothetical protein
MIRLTSLVVHAASPRSARASRNSSARDDVVQRLTARLEIIIRHALGGRTVRADGEPLSKSVQLKLRDERP